MYLWGLAKNLGNQKKWHSLGCDTVWPISIKDIFWSVWNKIDFALRSRIRWSRAIPIGTPISAIDRRLQEECQQFLALFNWQPILKSLTPFPVLTIADIGARNFAFAPALDKHFKAMGYEATVHGIEIDAYRRLINFHTRADYGNYFAKSIRSGQYHPIDFLTWHQPLQIGFLLNPFVTREALLAWGLPLSTLQPEAIFHHAYSLLKPQNGVLILSNIDEHEITISYQLAKEAGFVIGEAQTWFPTGMAKALPRFGTVLYTYPPLSFHRERGKGVS